jgi:hypothetical protein
MRILSSVVYPATCFLPVSISYDHHRCAVGTQFVRYYNFRLAIALHWFSYEFQRGLAISTLTYVTFQNFTFVIYSTLKVVPFTIDLHKHLIKVPLPIRMTVCLVTSFPRNLCSKHWPEAVPPKPDRFMAYIYTPFMKKVLHITKRKRKSNVHHYCKTDDFRAGFEVVKWGTFRHSAWLQISPARFKQVYSGSALTRQFQAQSNRRSYW